ncbi:hypothetical protein SUDANB15_02841 [Streptomyces sp. enrichment culture]|uniref:peptidoglycan-binding protein n=1 Tax=Streptomyces sp. enrichment culture TaxID=1795815 RepID=UPI003F57A924
MESPVFEEFDPAGDCDCPGCVHWRRVLPHSPAGRPLGHPAADRIPAVAATATGAHAAPALAAPSAAGRPATPAVPSVPAGDGPDATQGARTPLHGPGGRATPPACPAQASATIRASIVERARKWVEEKVPYSLSPYWSDGSRRDRSGHVSAARGLPGNEWTGSPGKYAEGNAEENTEGELRPDDVPVPHHPAGPHGKSRVVPFGGRADAGRTSCAAHGQARPHTRRTTAPYAHRHDPARRVPYRHKGVTGTAAGAGREVAGPSAAPGRTPFPGTAYFGPGAHNRYVTELGRMLAGRDGARFHAVGPGPRWTDADRRATRAFRRAQGRRGAAADGLPGPLTRDLLVTGGGRDIPAGASGPPAPAPPFAPSSHGVPGCPGRALLRPGADDAHVARLGRRLVEKGFGRYFTREPGPRWSEEHRRGAEAFQRAQGRRGGAADGHPGPETWRRLFS